MFSRTASMFHVRSQINMTKLDLQMLLMLSPGTGRKKSKAPTSSSRPSKAAPVEKRAFPSLYIQYTYVLPHPTYILTHPCILWMTGVRNSLHMWTSLSLHHPLRHTVHISSYLHFPWELLSKCLKSQNLTMQNHHSNNKLINRFLSQVLNQLRTFTYCNSIESSI